MSYAVKPFRLGNLESKTINQTYTADKDGIIYAMALSLTVASSTYPLRILVDDSGEPTTERAKFYSNNGDTFGQISFAVKRGQSYKVTNSSGNSGQVVIIWRAFQ